MAFFKILCINKQISLGKEKCIFYPLRIWLLRNKLIIKRITKTKISLSKRRTSISISTKNLFWLPVLLQAHCYIVQNATKYVVVDVLLKNHLTIIMISVMMLICFKQSLYQILRKEIDQKVYDFISYTLTILRSYELVLFTFF